MYSIPGFPVFPYSLGKAVQPSPTRPRPYAAPTRHCGFLCVPLCSNNPTFWQNRFQVCFETNATRQGDCAACTSWTGCYGSLATGVAACGAVNGTCF